jgi:hypothetical protein
MSQLHRDLSARLYGRGLNLDFTEALWMVGLALGAKLLGLW